jgi:ribosomal protein L13
MKTYLAPVNEIEKNGMLLMPKDKILGRLATEIATAARQA